MVAAPLLVGDYVTLNGLFLEDGLLAVYQLISNHGFYTASGVARKNFPDSQIRIYIDKNV